MAHRVAFEVEQRIPEVELSVEQRRVNEVMPINHIRGSDGRLWEVTFYKKNGALIHFNTQKDWNDFLRVNGFTNKFNSVLNGVAQTANINLADLHELTVDLKNDKASYNNEPDRLGTMLDSQFMSAASRILNETGGIIAKYLCDNHYFNRPQGSSNNSASKPSSSPKQPAANNEAPASDSASASNHQAPSRRQQLFQHFLDQHMVTLATSNQFQFNGQGDHSCTVNAVTFVEEMMNGRGNLDRILTQGIQNCVMIHGDNQDAVTVVKLLNTNHLTELEYHQDGALSQTLNNTDTPMRNRIEQYLGALQGYLTRSSAEIPNISPSTIGCCLTAGGYSYGLLVTREGENFTYQLFDSHGNVRHQYDPAYMITFQGADSYEQLVDYLAVSSGLGDTTRLSATTLYIPQSHSSGYRPPPSLRRRSMSSASNGSGSPRECSTGHLFPIPKCSSAGNLMHSDTPPNTNTSMCASLLETSHSSLGDDHSEDEEDNPSTTDPAKPPLLPRKPSKHMTMHALPGYDPRYDENG